MGASKIVDESEAKRWFEQGRTYQWMVDRYLEKYNLETRISMWSNLRSRRGWERRFVRDDDLIPWRVNPEHRWHYAVSMLRAEARRRAGVELTPEFTDRLERWLMHRREDDTVVHYDPDTPEGFWYVPRRVGIDTDLIRAPERKTTPKPRHD